MAGETAVARIAQAGKFLSFVLGDEEYGLEILKVQEINGMMGITRVPRAPGFMRGVINLRGRVIPVVSLRGKFDLPATDDTEKTCIVVVQVSGRDAEVTMGLVVDEVSEVLTIGDGQIEPSLDFDGGVDEAGFITGLGRLDNRTVILLDVDRVLDDEELGAVTRSIN